MRAPSAKRSNASAKLAASGSGNVSAASRTRSTSERAADVPATPPVAFAFLPALPPDERDEGHGAEIV